MTMRRLGVLMGPEFVIWKVSIDWVFLLAFL